MMNFFEKKLLVYLVVSKNCCTFVSSNKKDINNEIRQRKINQKKVTKKFGYIK